MEITQVQIKKVYNDPLKPIKAKVSVIIDNELVLHNIRVIERITDGVKKKFLSFPSQKVEMLDDSNEPVTGHFDIYHPINTPSRLKFEKAIYNALENYKNTNKD